MSKKAATPSPAYNSLLKHLKRSALLQSTSSMLTWDMETYMPSGGISHRSQQQSLLSELHHQSITSSSYRKKLQALIDIETGSLVDASLSPEQQACVKTLRRDFLKQSRLPSSFVKKFTETTSHAMHAWADAKKNNSFQTFLPHLKTIISLCRKKADYLGYQEHPYDALLDLYEPEMTSRQLTPLFSELQTQLTQLIREIKSVDVSCLSGHFPRSTQIDLGRRVMKMVGLEESHCRLDESVHPFCMGLHPSDVRITTKIMEDELLSSVGSVLHESGHALYENQLPADHFGTPLGQYCSLSIHESQSRFYEVYLGKSLCFWKQFYPQLQAAFPSSLSSVELSTIYRALHCVKPSLIRVESDEVTYNLHIILRFECEKALIDGSLQAEQIPEFWNDRMESYLSIRPDSFSNGCLQDIHWSMGGIGYFPTYTLGNLAAASLYSSFQKEHPDWQKEIEEGRFDTVRKFLYEKIHRHGRRYNSQTLLKNATGNGFQTAPFIDYLRAKYRAL